GVGGRAGEGVDGPARGGLVLAWWLEGDGERARDHLALARREAQNLEVRLVDAGKEPSRAGEAFSGIVLAWARRRGARTWLLEQGEPIADAFGEAFRFGEPLPRGRDGRLELDAAEAYGEALARRYLVSDEARALLAAGGSTEVVPWTLLDSLAHLDCTPDEWTEEDLDELLLRQVPAHLELPPEHASRGRDEMIAFLRFLRRAFG